VRQHWRDNCATVTTQDAYTWPAHASDLWARRHETTNCNPPARNSAEPPEGCWAPYGNASGVPGGARDDAAEPSSGSDQRGRVLSSALVLGQLRERFVATEGVALPDYSQQGRLPATEMTSPTAGCNPSSQLLASAENVLPDAPGVSGDEIPCPKAAEESGLSQHLRMSRAARTLVTTAQITGRPARPGDARGNSEDLPREKAPRVSRPAAPVPRENAFGISGRPINGRYGRPTVRSIPDDSDDVKDNWYSEDEYASELEEDGDDALAGGFLKDRGADDNEAAASCALLSMMAFGSAICIGLFLLLLFCGAPVGATFWGGDGSESQVLVARGFGAGALDKAAGTPSSAVMGPTAHELQLLAEGLGLRA